MKAEDFPLVRLRGSTLQIGVLVEVDRKTYGSDLYREWRDVPTVAADAPDRERIGGKTGKPQGVGG